MFSEKFEISKCHNFLISYPIFIIFAPICREIFMLSFEMMVILDWTSPLIYWSGGRGNDFSSVNVYVVKKEEAEMQCEELKRCTCWTMYIFVTN